MKKLIITLLIVFSFANINKEIIYIEAKLYPKMMMLINNLQSKKEIYIAILANNKTINIAKIFEKYIKSNNLNIKVKILKKPNFKYDVYILTYPIDNKLLNEFLKHKKILFSISPSLIDKSMFSIYIGAKVYPYINPYLIKKIKIKINPIIFKVGKIYE